MNKLVASNISKTYQSGDHQTEVLSNISISISEGDTDWRDWLIWKWQNNTFTNLAGLEIPDQGDIFLMTLIYHLIMQKF